MTARAIVLPVHDDSTESRPLPAAAAAALSTGRLVEAIKEVRAAEGRGLMEARQRIEAWVQQHPALQAQFAEQQARMKRRLVGWVVAIDLALVAAVVWYFFGR